MLLWLLALASLALGQDDVPTPGGGASFADMTVTEFVALLGGGGSTVGIGGSGYSLWRLKSLGDAIESLRTDLAAAITKADDREAATRATMAEMDARITATSAPSEADTSLRERLARLETQHDERHKNTRQSFDTLHTAIEGVRSILLESRRG